MPDEFLTLLADADKKVQKFHAGAMFCRAVRQGFYDNSPWTFTFRAPRGPRPDATVNLIYALGDFDLPPHVVDEPPVGLRDMGIPVALGLDEATAILKQAGIHDVVTRTELSWQKYPGVTQPHYAFEAGDGLYFVGVKDRKVRRSPVEEGAPVGVA